MPSTAAMRLSASIGPCRRAQVRQQSADRRFRRQQPLGSSGSGRVPTACSTCGGALAIHSPTASSDLAPARLGEGAGRAATGRTPDPRADHGRNTSHPVTQTKDWRRRAMRRRAVDDQGPLPAVSLYRRLRITPSELTDHHEPYVSQLRRSLVSRPSSRGGSVGGSSKSTLI
jgi:hypothetical protein